MRVTDRRKDYGQTDRQNYYPQDCASIAASRGKKNMDFRIVQKSMTLNGQNAFTVTDNQKVIC